jgi:hypothetical protein
VSLRVAIADDSLLLRQGIARLLLEAGFDVVAQASTADALLAPSASIGPTWRSSTSGCRPRTRTRGSGG